MSLLKESSIIMMTMLSNFYRFEGPKDSYGAVEIETQSLLTKRH
jgi:hypothetical protein